jgi:hypothetical protein
MSAYREPESIERQFVRHVYAKDCQLPSGPLDGDPKERYVPASQEYRMLEQRRKSSGYEQPPINRFLAALRAAGCEYRPGRDVDSWGAQCPTHDDTRPSLQVRRDHDGTVWLKCWAGCSKEGILAALDLEWRDLWENSHHDHDRARPYIKPLLPAHLRRAMEDLLRLDNERRAAA